MQMVFMLGKFGGSTDAVQIALEIIKTYADGFFCWCIGA
jgi:hypothetical protein